MCYPLIHKVIHNVLRAWGGSPTPALLRVIAVQPAMALHAAAFEWLDPATEGLQRLVPHVAVRSANWISALDGLPLQPTSSELLF